MKSRGDNGISIQNYGHIHLTIINEGENESRRKRERKPSEKDTTADTEETMRMREKRNR